MTSAQIEVQDRERYVYFQQTAQALRQQVYALTAALAQCRSDSAKIDLLQAWSEQMGSVEIRYEAGEWAIIFGGSLIVKRKSLRDAIKAAEWPMLKAERMREDG